MNNIFEEEFPLDLAYYIFNQESSVMNSPEDLAGVINKYRKELFIKYKHENIIFQKEYHGFESSFDIERDVYEAMDELPGEYLGTIKITIEYIENED